MAIVLSILRRAHARGTHHQLTLDAVAGMTGPDAPAWERLFYRHIALLMDGAKAPDTAFKDFENHVLHPRAGFWGGAVGQAATWYAELVTSLQGQNWSSAAYAAGVLSHYVTDPMQPLHTHQTEAENNIHAAVERSVSQSYAALRQLGLSRPSASQALTKGATIAALLHDGAQRATTHYETILTHYDIKRGVVAPEEGLDLVGRQAMADQVVHASRVVALLLDRAIAEANVKPPIVSLAGAALQAFLRMPVSRRERLALEHTERRQVEAMYDELMATGRVDATLPDDERKIRDLFAALEQARAGPADVIPRDKTAVDAVAPSPPAAHEAAAPELDQLDPEDPAGAVPAVRKRVAVETPRPAPPLVQAPDIRSSSDTPNEPTAPLRPSMLEALALRPPAAAASANAFAAAVGFADLKPLQIDVPPSAGLGSGLATYRPVPLRTAMRGGLALEADVVDAPSIGPKMAAKFNAVGIDTVGDFLKAHPIALEARLDDQRLTAQILTAWQDQTRLMCALGNLRAADAKLLVGAGYRTVEAITNVPPDQLSADILQFALTKDGQALLREGHVPDVERIRGWAEAAREAVMAA